MATDEVLFEKTGHVAVITLNRPEVLNALNATVMSELARIPRRGGGRHGHPLRGAHWAGDKGVPRRRVPTSTGTTPPPAPTISAAPSGEPSRC